jgi:hypothetical protein
MWRGVPERCRLQTAALIIGTGSVPHGLAGHLVYAMRVTEILAFEQYWADPRFINKRPNLNGSTRDAYGDNIYEFVGGSYIQQDSYHSLDTGEVNLFNLNKDTGADAVLISDDYVYYGADGPEIPEQLRTYAGYDLCASTQGHRCKFPAAFVGMIDDWFSAMPKRGVHGIPADWD